MGDGLGMRQAQDVAPTDRGREGGEAGEGRGRMVGRGDAGLAGMGGRGWVVERGLSERDGGTGASRSKGGGCGSGWHGSKARGAGAMGCRTGLGYAGGWRRWRCMGCMAGERDAAGVGGRVEARERGRAWQARGGPAGASGPHGIMPEASPTMRQRRGGRDAVGGRERKGPAWIERGMGRERRGVGWVGEKPGSNPGSLGCEAECFDHSAARTCSDGLTRGREEGGGGKRRDGRWVGNARGAGCCTDGPMNRRTPGREGGEEGEGEEYGEESVEAG